MKRESWSTWVAAGTVARALDREDLVLLDARFELADPGAGEAAWRQSRIPGARFADLDRDLSAHRHRDADTATKPGSGRHPWPAATDFSRRLGTWGITPGTQVVVYDAAGGALAAARGWFLLRALGHASVAVLDGGWPHWQAAGLPVEQGAPAPVDASAPYPGRFDDALLLDASRVQAHLASGGLLLDARAAERFRGDVEPIDRVGGHVPGALNRPFADNLRDGLAKPPQELAREFQHLLAGREPASLVAMCGSGVTACHHLLAMAHAGMPGARLFTGSWSGWIEDPARPVARGD